MKVNHAGEPGAANIYAGQLLMARLTARNLLPELSAFKAHEERHRAIFQHELAGRGMCRCRSYGLCGLGGYVLGIFTGLLGARAISLMTAAVERIVRRHLRQQHADLQGDAAAIAAIDAIMADEQSHLDLTAGQSQVDGVLSGILVAVVSGATEAVIWSGMHLHPAPQRGYNS